MTAAISMWISKGNMLNNIITNWSSCIFVYPKPESFRLPSYIPHIHVHYTGYLILHYPSGHFTSLRQPFTSTSLNLFHLYAWPTHRLQFFQASIFISYFHLFSSYFNSPIPFCMLQFDPFVGGSWFEPLNFYTPHCSYYCDSYAC